MKVSRVMSLVYSLTLALSAGSALAGPPQQKYVRPLPPPNASSLAASAAQSAAATQAATAQSATAPTSGIRNVVVNAPQRDWRPRT